jgi:D-serine deaminase-like pyridoxal phosphate-dependent protein
VKVGDKVMVTPAHVDPTVAMHERLHVVDATGAVVDVWPVDLRGW